MFKTISCNAYTSLAEDDLLHCHALNSNLLLTLPPSKGRERDFTVFKKDTTEYKVVILNPAGETLKDAVYQVETLTVVGTVTLGGNATVVVTSASLPNGGKSYSVPVLVDDTAAIVAGKIYDVLLRDLDLTSKFAVAHSGATVVLTSLFSGLNDATLNMSCDNGTCTGLTTVSTSAITTAAIAITLTDQDEYITFVPSEGAWVVKARL